MASAGQVARVPGPEDAAAAAAAVAAVLGAFALMWASASNRSLAKQQGPKSKDALWKESLTTSVS